MSTLPPEKMAEVYDFVTFLQERYDQRTDVDMSEACSEEDLHDLVQASLAYAECTIWSGKEELLTGEITTAQQSSAPIIAG